MTRFDQEMKLFEEIKNKYKPIEGYHLVLDLDAYKNGLEILHRFSYDSDEYLNFVNIESHEKNLLLEFEDYSPNPYKLNRTLKHQMELLIFDLTHPKPSKPVC